MVPLQGAKGTVEVRERAAQPPLSHAVSVERGGRGRRWEKRGQRVVPPVSERTFPLCYISSIF